MGEEGWGVGEAGEVVEDLGDAVVWGEGGVSGLTRGWVFPGGRESR